MNNANHSTVTARLPATPDEVIAFVGQNFTHEYLHDWFGVKSAAVDVRYEISVGALLESFNRLTQCQAAAMTEQPARQDAGYAELRAACENVLSDQRAIHCSNFDMLANPAAVLTLLADNDRLTQRLAHHDEAANKCIDTAISQGLAERDALTERMAMLEAALRFYADGQHFYMHQPDAWDTVSGEPMNFYEDESNTATVEDGTVAKMALAGTPIPDDEAATPHPHTDEAAKMEPTAAARDVLAERERQTSVEGWTPGHDDEHDDGQLAVAAACYAVENSQRLPVKPPPSWPWDTSWWKPKGNRRNLVKAGALILAEIERLDRAAQTPDFSKSGRLSDHEQIGT